MDTASIRNWVLWALVILVAGLLLRDWFQPMLPFGLKRPIFIAAGSTSALAIISIVCVRPLHRVIDVAAWRRVAAVVALIGLAVFVLCSPHMACHAVLGGSKSRIDCPIDYAAPVGL